ERIQETMMALRSHDDETGVVFVGGLQDLLFNVSVSVRPSPFLARRFWASELRAISPCHQHIAAWHLLPDSPVILPMPSRCLLRFEDRASDPREQGHYQAGLLQMLERRNPPLHME